jgi:hypothetical protein
MSARASARRSSGQALKNPFAVPNSHTHAARPAAGSAAETGRLMLPPRARQIADLSDHLRSITKRWGRPYEEITISTYTYPAKALDAWMTKNGIEGDSTVVDTAMLNRYFRDYHREHGQGGTNAQQRNLLPLLNSSRKSMITSVPAGTSGEQQAHLASTETDSTSHLSG